VIKILVVSNFPLLRAGMKAALKANDIRVVGEAATEGRALRLVKTRAPHIVLTHFSPNYTDSLDLTTRIKEKRPPVSVIILTKSESTLFLSRAIAIGCSGYFPENVEPADLLKAVRAVGRGESVIEPSLMSDLLAAITRQYDGKAGPPGALSAGEREILHSITEGKTNRQIATEFHLSVATVKDHVQKIIEKLEVSDRTQAAVKAIRLGLIK
jgi:two-component system NarL family response regulator